MEKLDTSVTARPRVLDIGAPASSVADYAVAMIDELENPQHTGHRFTVGY